MNPALFRRLRAAFAFTAALAAGLSQAAPLSIRLDGLPSGLQASVTASSLSCNPSGGLLEPVGTWPLTETTVPVFERVALAGGQFSFQTRLVPVYSIEDRVFPQTACDGGIQFTLRVVTDRAGERGHRRGSLRHEVLSDGTFRVHQTVEGRSEEPHIKANPFVQVTRGIRQTVIFTNRNPFGSSELHVLETGLPSLSFIRQVAPTASNPLPRAIVTRLFINTDGAKCIQAAGVTKCRSERSLLGSTLEHGGVSLDASDNTRIERGDSVNSSAYFTFKLAPDFPAGAYTLRTQAEDLGDYDYLVNGVPTPMDLMKWVTFSQSLIVQ
jgi:hypothetical protein